MLPSHICIKEAGLIIGITHESSLSTQQGILFIKHIVGK